MDTTGHSNSAREWCPRHEVKSLHAHHTDVSSCDALLRHHVYREVFCDSLARGIDRQLQVLLDDFSHYTGASVAQDGHSEEGAFDRFQDRSHLNAFLQTTCSSNVHRCESNASFYGKFNAFDKNQCESFVGLLRFCLATSKMPKPRCKRLTNRTRVPRMSSTGLIRFCV